MLDLETLSSASDAAIVAIGAVRFDPVAGIVWAKSFTHFNGTFYSVVNLKSAQRAGGRIDADTVMWWMGQSDAARSALLAVDCIPIEAALKDFAVWAREGTCSGVWGNGADFDNVILSNAYQRLGQTQPWSYAANRCYRTMKNMAPHIKMKREGTHHNALDDAISQARHLCEIYKYLNLLKNEKKEQ
jgi:3' exoribonuclease, RNase T-like